MAAAVLRPAMLKSNGLLDHFRAKADLQAVLAVALGGVERLVGKPQDAIDMHHAAGKEGQTDTHRHRLRPLG